MARPRPMPPLGMSWRPGPTFCYKRRGDRGETAREEANVWDTLRRPLAGKMATDTTPSQLHAHNMKNGVHARCLVLADRTQCIKCSESNTLCLCRWTTKSSCITPERRTRHAHGFLPQLNLKTQAPALCFGTWSGTRSYRLGQTLPIWTRRPGLPRMHPTQGTQSATRQTHKERPRTKVQGATGTDTIRTNRNARVSPTQLGKTEEAIYLEGQDYAPVQIWGGGLPGGQHAYTYDSGP